MIRKFTFWVVATLIGSLGLIVFIHWDTLRKFHEKTAIVQPLHQRQKILAKLNLDLEKYRRMSGNFRKLTPEEVSQNKDSLKASFHEGLSALGRLVPTDEERAKERHTNEQISELLSLSTQVEPTLFSRDAYHKPEIQALHEDIVRSLRELNKKTEDRLSTVVTDTANLESRSLIFLLGAGVLILVLTLGLILRTYVAYVRPLNRLRDYASDLGQGKPVPSQLPDFPSAFGEIQTVLNQLAQGVETHVRDRHKFILDVVADLRSPLALLRSGRNLMGSVVATGEDQDQLQASEAVRRGLAIVSGSLDDLNDIVDINRLESRLEEKTIDVSDLLRDVGRILTGTEQSHRISVTVPPIPVWASLDVKRMERVLILALSKVIETLPKGGSVAMTVSQSNQANFRGIEISIQDAEKQKHGRSNAAAGPEQDILKHWISETGLSMLLAHKIVKAHGGTLTAAGVAGTSVIVTVRLPLERLISHGLISPPVQEGAGIGLRGAISPEGASPKDSSHQVKA